MGDFKYFLIPKDFCGLDHVKGLMKAGVSCLKIEGRLKDASYVAATTRAYRNAVDEVRKEMYPDDDNVVTRILLLQEKVMVLTRLSWRRDCGVLFLG
mmetsp:Transcript_52872/g.78391  ORF Transcript_52872/g.78391 Transcript_52872/m.78391 type:complete len:97 (-) Transcript_52872:1144-1434(-)